MIHFSFVIIIKHKSETEMNRITHNVLPVTINAYGIPPKMGNK